MPLQHSHEIRLSNLPESVVSCIATCAPGSSRRPMQAQPRARVARNQFLQGRRYAAKRLGSVTTSFEIKLDHSIQRLGLPLLSSLEQALLDVGKLHNVRCFSFEATDDFPEDTI